MITWNNIISTWQVKKHAQSWGGGHPTSKGLNWIHTWCYREETRVSFTNLCLALGTGNLTSEADWKKINSTGELWRGDQRSTTKSNSTDAEVVKMVPF